MIRTQLSFKDQILQGIPENLPEPKEYDRAINHAPKRKDILSLEEKKLALKNALRYFSPRHHEILASEFYSELEYFGRIYMHRFRPDYAMKARPITAYPHQSLSAAAIMLMIQNNLDPAVAQHPHELITYGGNGAVFQNWAQYLLTMKYLASMSDEQTLHMYSGHPMGLFPSSKEAPRVVVTNGMMIPNYSRPDDLEKYNALGVTQYGQMTKIAKGRSAHTNEEGLAGKLFVTSGLGGMSGAQPKAGSIAGCITVVAEVNEKATEKRQRQGWVDEVTDDLGVLSRRVNGAKKNKEVVSIAYQGNVVDVWEHFDKEGIFIDMGSDQTSLHNPWSGGYVPAGMSYDDALAMMVEDPDQFKMKVQESLRRQVAAIDRHAGKGTYFFDYGNAFLLEASRAGANVMSEDGVNFKYPSYVQDIMGPRYHGADVF